MMVKIGFSGRVPGVRVILVLMVLMAMGSSAFAQRRKGTKSEGTPAKVIFRQDFEKKGLGEFEPNSYCSARFLKATMPDVMSLAAPKGFEARWVTPGIGGSKGAIELVKTGEATGAAIETYMDIPGNETLLAFAYKVHGVAGNENLYVQGWGKQVNKNLHAYVSIPAEDSWQIAKIKLDSMVGFGGGACVPGEVYGNLAFVLSWGETQGDIRVLLDSIVILEGTDGVPPSKPPSSLAAKQEGGDVVLSWSAAEDDIGLLVYDVHRGTMKDFAPRKSNRVGSSCDTTFTDRGVAAGEVHYVVVARDVGGFMAPSASFAFTTQATSAAPAQNDMEF